MLDDFTPIIHRLDGRTIKVWAIADVHIGAKEANIYGKDGFANFLKRVESDPDSYLIICGDLLNNGLRSANCPTDIYQETMPPSSQIELAAELLDPVKDKILGAVGGNHELRTSRQCNIDILYNVFCLIRKPELYRPNMCFVRVNLERGNTKEHYSMLLIHGKTANRQRQFSYSLEGVDVLICGHTHSGFIEKNTRICFGQSGKVTMRPIVNMTATSWLEYGDYAARNMYLGHATSNPQALQLEFSGTNARKGRISVIW